MAKISSPLIIALFLLILSPMRASASIAEPVKTRPDFLVKIGVKADGLPTLQWLDVLRERRSPSEIAEVRSNPSPFSKVELEWLRIFQEQVPDWKASAYRLDSSFDSSIVPATITFIFGNQGGLQAGVVSDKPIIAIDLGKWGALHGDPKTKANAEELARQFLSECYIRMLASIWGQTRFPAQTALDRALLDLYLDGISKHKFLDKRFLPYKGRTPQVSKDALSKLTPVLVENLSKLRNADLDDEMSIRSSAFGIRLEDSWGTFPVALWLASETTHNEKSLQSLIQDGPIGVLHLVRRNIAQDLKPRVDKLIQAARAKKHLP